jgi:hypothetical protein
MDIEDAQGCNVATVPRAVCAELSTEISTPMFLLVRLILPIAVQMRVANYDHQQYRGPQVPLSGDYVS